MAGAATPRLQATGLACVRGRRTLFQALDLQLAGGELLRVEGANGAGKSSLLRLLAGLALPSSGEVLWQGLPIRGQRESYARDLLYLGHLGGMKEELTPLENLQADRALSAPTGAAPDVDACQRALLDWGLAASGRLPLRLLSAGQLRRVALARVSLNEATLWILDEPLTALDVQAVAQLSQLIDQHLARGGLAVVTSHQPLALATTRVQTVALDA